MTKPLFYSREEYNSSYWAGFSTGFAVGGLITFMVLAFIGLWLP